MRKIKTISELNKSDERGEGKGENCDANMQNT